MTDQSAKASSEMRQVLGRLNVLVAAVQGVSTEGKRISKQIEELQIEIRMTRNKIDELVEMAKVGS